MYPLQCSAAFLPMRTELWVRKGRGLLTRLRWENWKQRKRKEASGEERMGVVRRCPGF